MDDFVCDGCGSCAWLPEEVVPFNQMCRGKRGEDLIHELLLVPNAASPAKPPA